MYKILFLVCLLTGFCFMAKAQTTDSLSSKGKSKADDIRIKNDTTVNTEYVPKIKKEKVFKPDTNHSPHSAVIRSLLIPGWGQVYNHRWWKVPVIYGGLGLLGAVIIFNQSNYKLFTALAQYREHGIIPTAKDKYYAQYQLYLAVPDQSIYDASDSYDRDRDLGIFGVLGVWGINVVDAYIDAKFIHSYTVDNNLSMRVTPGFLTMPTYALNSSTGSFIPGIKITFTLR
jgi:hypothetical protein